ncbi:MAG: hypothetical protein PHW96_04440 [Candidatus Nanoarchaeia archaeon]|nr:hypothetical protein [Candidatus Nanoarchaeia archaeon]
MGEIRSKEAISLYEAMRVGAMANVVAGTIHADSPYGIFDRVVNDLGVPTTSFKATDIAVTVTKVRSPSGLNELRRVVDISEVRKHWTHDPLKEQGFFRLMEYDAKKDTLVPTNQLLEGESEVIKDIASRVKDWVGNWDRIWENIILRARTKKLLVDYSEKINNNDILESDFTVVANDQFHRIMDDVKKEIGYPEPKEVLRDYELWLKSKVKTMKK